jgi:hypothetical protein
MLGFPFERDGTHLSSWPWPHRRAGPIPPPRANPPQVQLHKDRGFSSISLDHSLQTKHASCRTMPIMGSNLLKVLQEIPLPSTATQPPCPLHLTSKRIFSADLTSLGFQAVIACLGNHAIKNQPSLIDTALAGGITH